MTTLLISTSSFVQTLEDELGVSDECDGGQPAGTGFSANLRGPSCSLSNLMIKSKCTSVCSEFLGKENGFLEEMLLCRKERSQPVSLCFILNGSSQPFLSHPSHA